MSPYVPTDDFNLDGACRGLFIGVPDLLMTITRDFRLSCNDIFSATKYTTYTTKRRDMTPDPSDFAKRRDMTPGPLDIAAKRRDMTPYPSDIAT